MTPSAKSNPARDAAVAIVRRLQAAHHVAYLAGGCVRDELLGLTPKDYDVATSAKPPEVRHLFSGARRVGEAFGVMLVRQRDQFIEVATFRAESDYADGRRPTHVTFTDAAHDAERRDFTINGLFEDPLANRRADRVIDYVDGLADLQRKRVRAIGDPDQRFSEDYLRMLRAVRFAARLGFSLEGCTAAAIRSHAGQLTRISRERIGQELAWMLTPAPSENAASDPARAVELIQRLGLDAPVLDESHSDAKPRLVTALQRQASTAVSPAYATVLAAWILDRHLPQQFAGRSANDLPDTFGRFVTHTAASVIRRWRHALCLTNDHRDALRHTLQLMAKALTWPTLHVAGRKRLLAETLWPQAHSLVRAMASTYTARLPFLAIGAARTLRNAARQVDRDAPTLLAQGVWPTPLVNGDDLLALGRKPGPAIGRLLHQAYDAQLEGRIRSKSEAIAWVSQRR